MMEAPQDWAVDQVLGQGSFGQVKKIVNRQTEEAMAMKVVDTSLDEWCSADIKQEIYIHKALKHANIVCFFGQQTEDRMAYLFLEYCSGGELFHRIQPGVGLGETQAHRYFVQLMAAVEYLHRMGVTHRDIKPENILLDESDNLKLADFGFAAVFRRRSGSGGSIERLFSKRCGTRPYMAPEVLVQTEFRGPPADLWACGVVLTAMLTGELPWDQASDTCQRYLDWLEKKIYLTPWNKIHPTPLSLLSKLLLASPEGRISIPDIKSHRWFTQTQRASGNLRPVSQKLDNRLGRDLSAVLDEFILI